MEVKEFEKFISTAREEFIKLFEKDTGKMQNDLLVFLRKKSEKCCSEYEVNTLTENLKEAYDKFLQSKKGD